MPVRSLKKGPMGIAGAIRKSIGATPTEDVQVMTPQFEREPGYPPPASPPADRAAFEALAMLDAASLRELGLRPWGVEEDEHGNEIPGGRVLWVFPGEWYTKIPAGFPIVDIFFRDEVFIPGETDDGIRFGVLSFGIIGPALTCAHKPEIPIQNADDDSIVEWRCRCGRVVPERESEHEKG